MQVESRLSGVPLQSLSMAEVQSRNLGATAPTQVVPQDVLPLSADSMQVRVPGLHGGVLLPVQVCVVFAEHAQLESALSAVPLQSLSLVDVQSRAWAFVAPTQVPHAELAQVWVPALQIPTAAGPHPRVVPLTQVQPSCGCPLQLSSFVVSQPSAGAGPTAPVHGPQALVFLSAATTQACEPALQGPLPSWPGCCPQAWVAPDLQAQTASLVLSGWPSQSLSAVEVQSRVAGITAPTQAPHDPAVQVCVPRLQIPTLAAGPQAWVVPATQVHPSFGTPLQLSSLPVSQVSFAAGATPPLQAPQVLVFLSAATAHV